MGRLREFDPDQALQGAMELFWEKGYDLTSMEDLVRKTGVSRYGFYSTFGDKRDLYTAAFRRYRDQVVAIQFGPLQRPDAAMPEVLEVFRVIRMKVAEGDTRGCLIANTAAQLAPNDERFCQLTQEVFDQIGTLFERAFSNGVQLGQLPPAFKVKDTAKLIAGATLLLPLMVHAGFSQDRIEGYLSAMEATLMSS